MDTKCSWHSPRLPGTAGCPYLPCTLEPILRCNLVCLVLCVFVQLNQKVFARDSLRGLRGAEQQRVEHYKSQGCPMSGRSTHRVRLVSLIFLWIQYAGCSSLLMGGGGGGGRCRMGRWNQSFSTFMSLRFHRGKTLLPVVVSLEMRVLWSKAASSAFFLSLLLRCSCVIHLPSPLG